MARDNPARAAMGQTARGRSSARSATVAAGAAEAAVAQAYIPLAVAPHIQVVASARVVARRQVVAAHTSRAAACMLAVGAGPTQHREPRV